MLPLPDSGGMVRCPSCGRVAHADPPAVDGTEASDDRSDDEPFATWTPGPAPPRATTTRSAARVVSGGLGVGCVVAIVGLVALIVGIVVVARSVSEGTGPFGSLKPSSLYPLGGSTVVVPGEASGTDLITVVSDNSDDSARKLVRVVLGPDGGTERWRSEALPSDAYSVVMAIDGDHLWVGGNDDVRLLSLRTGRQQWIATVSDAITTRCDACFAVVDGTLVVRSNDAYVTAFGPGSSEARWSRRLQSPAANVSVVGERLLVVDDPPAAQDTTQVVELEPATGKVVRTAAPSCPASEVVPFPLELSAGDPVYGVPGTDDLVAYFGFGYGCITRWEATTGTVRWRTGIEGGNFDDRTPLVTATHLVAQRSSNGPVRVDLGTGKAAAFEQIVDTDAVPRAIVDGTVLAETTTTRGTTRGGLAAWDLASGRRLWSARLPGTSQPTSEDSSDALFDGQARTLLVTGGSQVRLVTFTGSDRSIRIQTVDPATGDLGPARTANLRSRYASSGTPSVTVESVTPDRLVIHVDSIIETVRLRDGAEASWPPKN